MGSGDDKGVFRGGHEKSGRVRGYRKRDTEMNRYPLLFLCPGLVDRVRRLSACLVRAAGSTTAYSNIYYCSGGRRRGRCAL